MEQQYPRLDRIEKNLDILLQGISELRDAQAKTDEQLKRTDKKLEIVTKQLGDMGFVQGEVAEDLFYRNTKNIFRKRGMNFATVIRNLKKKGAGEYDIVAKGRNEVLVIEVKNKLSYRMVDQFLEKRLPKFKRFFPEYQDRKLRGGIGSLVVKDEVGRYAEEAGLFVLTQTNEGGATLWNREDFTPKEFQ